MGVIIGSGTTITGFNHAVSANWGASTNTQRLFVLGSTDAYMTIKKPTATFSVTVYSTGPAIPVGQSSGCSAASTKNAGVSASPCGTCGGSSSVDGDWYVTSYSFSKESSMPGQESFSMMKYIEATGATMPNVVIRGIAEGSWTPDSGVAGTADGSAESGSVSAGGLGRADSMSVGVVTSVGGATAGIADTGQASVSIPYTPIYC